VAESGQMRGLGNGDNPYRLGEEEIVVFWLYP
jgi:hypothetical protein